MRNLERMKKNICQQIMEMDEKKLYEFILEMEEIYDFETSVENPEKTLFDMEGLLTCEKCRELYGGKCDESEQEIGKEKCFERFKKYCHEE